MEISIHAPAKGATKTVRIFFGTRLDFNPRSREGSDFQHAAFCKRKRNFNPRSREGSDMITEDSWMTGQISIHAPAKGATKKVKSKKYGNYISIHAPAKGATLATKRCTCELAIFQSTLPRRERQIKAKISKTSKDFNPRSREGSDTF